MYERKCHACILLQTFQVLLSNFAAAAAQGRTALAVEALIALEEHMRQRDVSGGSASLQIPDEQFVPLLRACLAVPSDLWAVTGYYLQNCLLNKVN